MTMVKFDVDTTAKLFICKVGITAFDVRVDLYSDAKEHWIDDATANKHTFPMAAFGGNDIDVGAGTRIPTYAFLLNGWRIRPQEATHTLTVGGAIVLVDGGGDPFVNTIGSFIVRILYQQPVQAIAFNSGGVIAPTQQQIRDAMTLNRTLSPAIGSIDEQLTPPSAHLSVAADDAANTLDLIAWLTRGNAIVTAPTALSIVWRNPDGTTLFSLTQAQATLLATGHYSVNNWAQALAADTSYQVAVTITDSTGAVTTQRSVVTT